MDNLNIQNHLRSLSAQGQLPSIREVPIIDVPVQSGNTTEPGFGSMLTDSIMRVNEAMLDSDKAIEDLTSGKSGNVHGTLIAMQKAEVSFKTLIEIRNKIMRAYEEVMRMQA
jgi:flagellar hook-basal body complex protein FliE